MDPFTAIGTVASVSQLISLCVKTATAAREFYNAFTDAPDEIRRLGERLMMLRCVLDQIAEFGTSLCVESMDEILPVAHRSTILAALYNSILRWAALERSRASKALKVLNDVDRDLNTCLVIANSRLSLLNQVSLRQLQAAQAVTLPKLEASSVQIRDTIARIREVKEISLLVQKDVTAIRSTITNEGPQPSDSSQVQSVSRPGPKEYMYRPHGSIDFEQIKKAMSRRSVGIGGSQTNGFNPDRGTFMMRPATGSKFRLSSQTTSSKNTKHLKMKLRIWLDVFGCQVVDFDVHIGIRLRALLSPNLTFGIRVVNIRSNDSAIIKAFNAPLTPRELYLRVKSLMESGQAGINDVDSWGQSILLLAMNETNYELVEYLLDCGSDPNPPSASIYSDAPLHRALGWGMIEHARLLVRAGANLHAQNSPPLDTSISWFRTDHFIAGVEFLLGHDYWDWQIDTSKPATDSILTAATGSGSLEEIMRLLYQLQLVVTPKFPTIVRACGSERIEVVSLLMKLGADVNTPLRTRGTEEYPSCWAHRSPGIAHYLLSLEGDAGQLWCKFWQMCWLQYHKQCCQLPQFRFQELELLLLHMAIHATGDTAPHELIFASPPLGLVVPAMEFTYDSLFRAGVSPLTFSVIDIARLFAAHNDNCRPAPFWNSQYGVDYSVEQCTALLETSFPKKGPQLCSRSARGIIHRGCSCLVTADIDPDPDPYGNPHFAPCSHYLQSLGSSNRYEGPSTPGLDQGDQMGNVLDDPDSPHYAHILREYDDGRESIPFDNGTLFYENLSTEAGRRQMETYPMVRALCNALLLAGYCVDMDGEGDVWFDYDEMERYQDAREYQPEDDSVVANCPICQDFDKYGLGYIKRRAEVGEKFVDEWRSKHNGKEKATNKFGFRL
ncbi:hypothetical protein QBC38DRAFT_502551 [Podospora fimiseda]|uniref:Fungal N-terminal domain-containing protein n=1 Tax=Podospora fimiseda TaxID=252190 RepID=A0AAN7GZD2_9PEZI|nr:hypothetical protein QBC38DRAFT_502551 [Podospora fimiseda]